MMYFTEFDDSCEDPMKLNDEFEAQYDTPKYEAKISKLLHHCYNRVKEEDPEKSREWDLALHTLRKGDHYILVLWRAPAERPRGDFLKLLGTGLLLAGGVAAAAVLSAKYNLCWPRLRWFLPRQNPHVLLALFLLAWVLAIFFPRVLLKPVNKCLDILFKKLARSKKGPDSEE